MSDLIDRLRNIERLTPALLVASVEEAADELVALQRERDKLKKETERLHSVIVACPLAEVAAERDELKRRIDEVHRLLSHNTKPDSYEHLYPGDFLALCAKLKPESTS